MTSAHSHPDKLSMYQTTIRYEDTIIANGGRATVVRYRGTPIVSFNDGCIELDTGGWRSVTTKRKINQAARQFGLGFSVYQSKFEWFLQLGNGAPMPFYGQTAVIDRVRNIVVD